jgi:hypothetical protein
MTTKVAQKGWADSEPLILAVNLGSSACCHVSPKKVANDGLLARAMK